MPINANGVPFDMSHIYAAGNVSADMLANVAADACGRVLASRLYNWTDDHGMKDFLSFLIARDACYQQQLAVIEELGGMQAQLQIPTPEAHEATQHSYYYLHTLLNKEVPKGLWSEGPSLDGKSQYSAMSQPAIKDLSAQLTGFGQAVGGRIAEYEVAKGSIACYTFENFEIAY